jgi:transcriptional regulator with XRE-family HTH domain
MNTDPFTETFAGLMEERGWSLRELSRRMEKDGDGLHHVTLSLMMRGEMPPSKRAMELISKAMRISPETFAEYRLETKREALDWRRRGLVKALRELD